MRNPGGKGLSQVHPAPFRKGRRDRRAAQKPRLKPACYKEEPPPWSPKESPSPPGTGLRTKLGVGKNSRPARIPPYALGRDRDEDGAPGKNKQFFSSRPPLAAPLKYPLLKSGIGDFYSPIILAIIVFITSVVPAAIEPMRASRASRQISYSSMYP